ncbi:hypothetical protein [Microbacterium aurum]
MRLTKLRGAADAAGSRLDAVRAAVERQQRALEAAQQRRAEAEEVLAGVDPDLVPEGSSAEHAAAYERAQRDAADAEAQVSALRERLHAAEREVESLTAQSAALSRALDVRNAAAALIERGGRGIRGLVGDAVKVKPGFEAAVAAALGALSEGVLVDDIAAALDVARTAREDDLGRVDILLASASAPAPDLTGVEGATPAADVVTGPEGVRGLLAYVAIVDDLAAAHDAARTLTTATAGAPVTIVTRAGEVVTPFTVRAGSGGGRSRLELRGGAGRRRGAAGRDPRRRRFAAGGAGRGAGGVGVGTAPHEGRTAEPPRARCRPRRAHRAGQPRDRAARGCRRGVRAPRGWSRPGAGGGRRRREDRACRGRRPADGTAGPAPHPRRVGAGRPARGVGDGP